MDIFLDIAKKAALEAGNHLRIHFGNSHEYTVKESNHSIVTKADFEAEKIIIQIIKTAFPNHLILSEESHPSINEQTNDYLWIIDPLDGTSYYARGIPSYSVSIALYHQNMIIIGVIYCPQTDELYWAGENIDSAFKNGMKINVSNITAIQSSIGSFSHRFIRLDEHRAEAKEYLQNVSSVRSGGSCAMELALLAEGKIDLFIALHQKCWDFSAGKLIVQKAGGKFTFYNSPNKSLNEALNTYTDIFANNGRLELIQ